MVNRDLLAAKLVEIATRIARVKSHLPRDVAELRSDADALDIVAFNLMLSVQSCSDIASHLITDEGWPAAQTLGDAFSRLEEQRVISSQTAQRLKQAVGLRNVVAHGYARLDVERCFEAATVGLGDLEDFARQVSAWVNQLG